VFRDDSLQRLTFDKLSKDRRERFLQNTGFRTRIREVSPELLGEFSPGTKIEDAAELKYLAGYSGMLRNLAEMIDARNPSEEKIGKFFEKARQKLRDVNPQQYDEMYSGIDDYLLVRQYDRIYSELKRSSS
jgi:hypothetical protein